MQVVVKKALVLSPHTDDAIIGAGGLIQKLAKSGCHIVHIVFSICDDTLVGTKYPKGQIADEDRRAAKLLGATEIIHHNFENKHLHKQRQEILDSIYHYRKDPEIELVIAPYTGDIHQDHRTVAEEAVRAFGRNHATLIQYPIMGTCKDFNPNLFIPLTSEEADKKIEAISLYKTQFELRNGWFNLDNFRSQLRVDGVNTNSEYAEAFVQLKGTWTIGT
ncbi:MAG: PIG-L family deacetylase [Candidatus Thorarchaeota archaeon]|nr:PIG-L family deacetylase [Candidatus Thorarchaeota archaeon]